MKDVAWSDGQWTTMPARSVERGTDLLVTAVEGSDAWRHTSYGFVHDTEHALLTPFAQGTAMEVDFTADFSMQFDQAGVFVRVHEEHWVKAGVEFVDGSCQLGAVVTDRMSDWSVSPVGDWVGRRVRVRVSRSGDALTVRAGLVLEQRPVTLQLVRVIPLDPTLEAAAGPFVCAPTRAGLVVTFHSWRLGQADSSLH